MVLFKLKVMYKVIYFDICKLVILNKEFLLMVFLGGNRMLIGGSWSLCNSFGGFVKWFCI